MRSARPPQDRKFGCPKCEKKFFTPKDLRRHENTHLGLRDHVCQLCHTRFGRKDHLTRHAKKSCAAVRNQQQRVQAVHHFNRNQNNRNRNNTNNNRSTNTTTNTNNNRNNSNNNTGPIEPRQQHMNDTLASNEPLVVSYHRTHAVAQLTNQHHQQQHHVLNNSSDALQSRATTCSPQRTYTNPNVYITGCSYENQTTTPTTTELQGSSTQAPPPPSSSLSPPTRTNGVTRNLIDDNTNKDRMYEQHQTTTFFSPLVPEQSYHYHPQHHHNQHWHPTNMIIETKPYDTHGYYDAYHT